MTADGQPRIGLIGVGNMGMPIARRLRAAGHLVDFYARRPEVIAEALALGCTQQSNSAAVGAVCDVVVVNVFTDDQVREVVLGPDGALGAMRPGSVIVSHATGRPGTLVEIAGVAAERGVDTLDAAMSGGPLDIDNGRLVLLVGGESAVFDRVRPVFSAYSDPILHVGGVGDGQKVKLLNNALFGAHVALVRQIEQTAIGLGMDPVLVLPAIGACSGTSYAVGVATMLGSATALVDAARKYIEKDVAVCADLAAELGADLGSVLRVAREI